MDDIPALFPGIDVRRYDAFLDLDEALHGADLVIVHEWNSPDLIAQIGRRRAQGAPFTLLFHDTHHRAVTAPEELAQFDLDGFDGVLAFGEVLRQIYLKLGWADRAFTWHEAADVALYHPLPHIERTDDLVWIGNWGDGERSAELNEFLVEPVAELKLRASVYGVRYSDAALETIRAAGIRLWRLAAGAPGSRSLRQRTRDGACAARPLCPVASGHPDHSRVRGDGLRHPIGIRTLVGCGRPVPRRHLFQRCQWQRR